MLLDRFCQLEIRITVGMLHMSKIRTGCIFLTSIFCCEASDMGAGHHGVLKEVATGRSIEGSEVMTCT